jgi:DNA-binding NarL/FixJ family response regulator
VADCESAQAAASVLDREPVDLILLDFDLGTQTGLDVIRELRSAGKQARIFLVTAGISDEDLLHALGAGVCGVFLKHSSPEQLIEVIRKVMAGETWIDPRCLSSLSQAVAKNAAPGADRRQLSTRERQVLKGVLDGLSNKEIAAQLDLSEASIKSALQQLFIKTGVRTRSQLVRVALEEYPETWREL